MEEWEVIIFQFPNGFSRMGENIDEITFNEIFQFPNGFSPKVDKHARSSISFQFPNGFSHQLRLTLMVIL